MFFTFNGSTTQARGNARAFRILLPVVFLSYLSLTTATPEQTNNTDIPHVNKKARHNFSLYRQADTHKAFAIAPGGAWSWHAEMGSTEEAETQSLQSCRRNTRQKCVLYAVDDEIVFNTKEWPSLWSPYVSAKDATKASVGAKVGERLYDIAYRDSKGRAKSLADSRGRLVLLHFWGSWCPPCMREFPELKKLHMQLKKKFTGKIDMLFLQVREPFKESQQWARANGFSSLPLYDSGSRDSDDAHLSLAPQGKILDRELARVFPSTYILDRNGIVLFSHYGPIENWQEYIPFIKHALRHSAAYAPGKPGATNKTTTQQ